MEFNKLLQILSTKLKNNVEIRIETFVSNVSIDEKWWALACRTVQQKVCTKTFPFVDLAVVPPGIDWCQALETVQHTHPEKVIRINCFPNPSYIYCVMQATAANKYLALDEKPSFVADKVVLGEPQPRDNTTAR